MIFSPGNREIVLIAAMLSTLSFTVASAAHLDSDHRAIRNALREQLVGCPPREARRSVDEAIFTRLGSIHGDRVALVKIAGSCVCEAGNCRYLVLRQGTRESTILLSTGGTQARAFGPAAPLPRLRVRSRDSALIAFEIIYAYNSGAYEAIATDRIRNDTGARKPAVLPIVFRPGGSSEIVTGSVAPDWYDAYTFTARADQNLIVRVNADRKLDIELLAPNGAKTIAVRSGIPVRLTAGGRYVLNLSVRGTDDVYYHAIVLIR